MGKENTLVSVERIDSESWEDTFGLPLVANTLVSTGKHCRDIMDVMGTLANWCCIR